MLASANISYRQQHGNWSPEGIDRELGGGNQQTESHLKLRKRMLISFFELKRCCPYEAHWYMYKKRQRTGQLWMVHHCMEEMITIPSHFTEYSAQCSDPHMFIHENMRKWSISSHAIMTSSLLEEGSSNKAYFLQEKMKKSPQTPHSILAVWLLRCDLSWRW